MTIVTEATQETNPLTFHQALLQAEAQARSTLDVALHERLSAAVALVTDGRVFQTSTGDWQVDSSSRTGLTYTVNGTCNCEDHHFNKPRYCKHQLAMFLRQRVATLMRQPPVPVVPEDLEPLDGAPGQAWPDNDPEDVPQSPAVETEPAPAPLPEAAFSLTLKGTLDGFEALLTARGQTAAEFTANLQAIRGLLDPVRTPASPQAPTHADTTPQCPTHGALKKSTKGKGWYCPTKLDDDTWCPSKGK